MIDLLVAKLHIELWVYWGLLGARVYRDMQGYIYEILWIVSPQWSDLTNKNRPWEKSGAPQVSSPGEVAASTAPPRSEVAGGGGMAAVAVPGTWTGTKGFS